MALDGLITLILYLLLGGIILFIIQWIISMLTLPQPVKTAILLLIAVLILLWLLRTFGLI